MKTEARDFAHFEWEDPPYGVELYLEPNDVLGPGLDRITMQRDERGALTFTAKGTAPPEEVSNRLSSHIRPGAVSTLDNQVDVNWPGGAGQLRGLLPLRWKERARSPGAADVEVRGSLAWFSATYSDEPAIVLTEWFVNLTDTFLWPDSTTTEIRSTYQRSRGSVAVGPEAPAEKANLETLSGRDHAEFTIRHLPDVTIQLGQARPPDTPCAVRPGFITYKSARGNLPDQEIRDAIRRCLGFMVGAELGHLGHISFSADGRLVEQYARHLSMMSGVDQILEDNARPPFRLANTDPEYGCYVDRTLFVRQIDGFLDATHELDLRHILALYWYAEAASPYVAAVLFGATLEAIRAEHENNHQPRSQGDSDARKRWKQARKLAAQTIETLRREGTLSESEATRFVDRIQGTDLIPQRDRWSGFFDGLGLRTGPVEDQALQERHRPAHGVPYHEGEFNDAIRRVRELRTLCNRVLLKITNGSDSYIDYTTEGFAERILDEPLGGTPPAQ